MAEPWTPLRPGEPIGVVALSGPADPARLETGLARLASWGHPVLLAPNVGTRDGYLAGSDAQRLAGLESVLDRGARWIMAARGGFGLTRLLPRLPWARLVGERVRFVGFSDLTAVLAPLAQRGVAQVHGPMVAGRARSPADERQLRGVLSGGLCGRPLLRFGDRQVVRSGRSRGRLVGGNLSVLAALLGTPWAPRTDGAVLLLEDVGEPGYRLDRLLTQLAQAGALDRVRAVLAGRLCGGGRAAARDEAWRRRLVELVPASAPVVVGLPFGHGPHNRALPLGVDVEVDTGQGLVRWSDTDGEVQDDVGGR